MWVLRSEWNIRRIGWANPKHLCDPSSNQQTRYFIQISAQTLFLVLSHTFHCFHTHLGDIHKCRYFRGERGGVCENQKKIHTLLTFWPDFYYFHGDFWHFCWCVLFWSGGRGYQKVYGLYTHENVDINGRPLSGLQF